MADDREKTTSSEATRAATNGVGTAPPTRLIKDLIERERVQLLRIASMMKCLYDVLLHADDDNTIFHADVANVAGCLVDESVARLEAIVLLCKADAMAAATNELPGSTGPGTSSSNSVRK